MRTYQENVNQLFDKANEYRDIARLDPEKIELFKDSAKIFNKLSNFYSSIIEMENIGEFVKEVFIAEKEHVDYESHFCLFMYFSQINDFNKAEYHYSNMKKNIQSAHQRITELLTNPSKPDDAELNNNINEDSITWEFFCLQLDAYYYGMKFRQAFIEKEYLKALDFIRMCIEELNLLKEKLPKYINYVGYEYRRVINSNYFAMCSNEQLDVMHSLAKNKVSSEVLIEIIRCSWKAYEFTVEAIRENPVQNYKEVLKEQQRIIMEILENEKENWQDLFIAFDDNKEFLKIMKKVDPKRFNLVKAELIYEENQTIRYWSIGSLLLLIFITIATTITIIAINVTKTWLVIPVFLTLEATFIIVSSFLIRATGALSEASLMELVKTAFKFQTLILKVNKIQGSETDNSNSNDTKI